MKLYKIMSPGITQSSYFWYPAVSDNILAAVRIFEVGATLPKYDVQFWILLMVVPFRKQWKFFCRVNIRLANIKQ
jgi:hypothetical protein